jgi:hypothetical protein
MNKYRVKISYTLNVLGNDIDEAWSAIAKHFPDEAALNKDADVLKANLTLELDPGLQVTSA